MPDAKAIYLPRGHFAYLVESPLAVEDVAIRMEGLRSRGLLRGFAPVIRPKVWAGGYRISADVGRNLWIHIEGEITPIPKGTLITGELSKGLGWRVFAAIAGVIGLIGMIGLISELAIGTDDGLSSWLALAFGIPGITAFAYLRITRTQRSMVRRLVAAVDGTLHVSPETEAQ